MIFSNEYGAGMGLCNTNVVNARSPENLKSGYSCKVNGKSSIIVVG